MTARTRLPTFLPISAVSRPGSIVPPITVGLLVKVLAFSEELVPSQKYRTKFAAMASLLVRVTPVPWMSVLTARSLPALAFGMVTVGVLPKDPLAMTDEFAVEEEDDEDDDDALDFDEPQPARTTQASRGTAMSARKRRMKTSMVVDVSFASLLEVLTRGDDPRSPPLLLPGGPIPPDPPWEGPVPPEPPWGGTSPPTSTPTAPRLHAGDEFFDPLVHRTERVLAQHGALGLVVQLEVHPVDGEVTPLLLGPADELTAQLGPRRLRRDRLGLEDVNVARGPLHRPGPLQQVVQAAAAVHVVVGQVELGHPRRGQRQVVPGPVALDQLVLGDPVDLPRDLVQVPGLDRGERPLPHLKDPLADRVEAVLEGEVLGPVQVLVLDVQGAHLAPVGQPDPAAPGHIVADLADRPDRVIQGQVAHDRAGLDHPQHQVGRSHLEQRSGLAHVGVADDHVQPPEALGVGVRLVPGVDDRAGPGGGRGHALPDVLGALADAVHRAPRRLQHFARAADDLPGDQERDQDVGQPAELAVPADQVVLVAAVGVARGVGVVLEQVDVPGDALLAQPPVGVDEQPLQDPLPRLVVGHEVEHVVAFGRGVLRVAAHVEVEPRPVPQEDVAAAAP